MDLHIILLVQQQHMLVEAVEENSHQIQEEMLEMVAPEAAVLVVEKRMVFLELMLLEVAAVAAECEIRASV